MIEIDQSNFCMDIHKIINEFDNKDVDIIIKNWNIINIWRSIINKEINLKRCNVKKSNKK